MSSAPTYGTPDNVLKLFAYSWIAWFTLPFLFLLLISVSHLDSVRAIMADGRFMAAFAISMVSAFAVIIITALFTVPTAYFLTYHRFSHSSIIEALLIDIPQTFPPVAVGVIYLFMLGPASPINIAYTFAAVVIAKLIVSAPFGLSYTLRKFREIRESKLDLVARSLGAGTRDLLFLVLIPLAKQDITAGLTLSWARAMGEFGGSLIFAGVIAYKTEILPTYANRVVTSDPYSALAATTVLTVFAVLAIAAVRSLFKK